MEAEIIRKINRNKEHDSFRLRDSRSMTLADALRMLEECKYKCTECFDDLLLADWKPFDPKQFSFDRIDDSQPHIAENIVITCLECNRKRAGEKYQPSESFNDYNCIKEEFFYICRNHINVPLRKKQLTTAAADLHEKTYGSRKSHKWRKYSVEPAKPDYNYIQTYLNLTREDY